MAASDARRRWRHLLWAAALLAPLPTGPALAQSCNADEVEVERTTQYITCEKRKVFECMKGARQRWSNHQRECARQTVAAAKDNGYVATASGISCVTSCLVTAVTPNFPTAVSCVGSCGVAGVYATRIVDNFVDSPCLNDLLVVQKKETQACKALADR